MSERRIEADGPEGPADANRRIDEVRAAEMAKVTVLLPAHLKTLAQVAGPVHVEVPGPVTTRAVLDALEASYPVLGGTIRDRATGKRRPFIRFFAGEEDLSHESSDAPLPSAVADGAEPFCTIGALAGG
jgi:molybdopterin synthase sulfur carrier subunit